MDEQEQVNIMEDFFRTRADLFTGEFSQVVIVKISGTVCLYEFSDVAGAVMRGLFDFNYPTASIRWTLQLAGEEWPEHLKGEIGYEPKV